jgi:hypothetical protein
MARGRTASIARSWKRSSATARRRAGARIRLQTCVIIPPHGRNYC